MRHTTINEVNLFNPCINRIYATIDFREHTSRNSSIFLKLLDRAKV